MKHLLGIEIGGTKLQIVAGDESANILERLRFPVDRDQGAAGIRARIEAVIPALVEKWKAVAVGVGFGGPVDLQNGRIARSHQVEGWSDFAIAAWLGGLSERPVWVDNDANVAALGEALRGAGIGFNPVFYMTLGSGVGGGLVVDGKIYHGARPGEAEIGHLRLDREGLTVEASSSGWAVDGRIRGLRKAGVASLLSGWIAEAPGGESKFLSRALQANDAAAWAILRETADNLAFALSHVTHLFHPEVIVMGGGLSLVGDPLRAAVAEALPRFVMEVFQGGPEIRIARLGEEAVPIGCLIGARSVAAA